MTNYRQCTFRTKGDALGYSESTAFIPEKLAEVGKQIYFGKKTDNPVRVWTVVSVSSTLFPGEYVHAHERDYKTQREASDI